MYLYFPERIPLIPVCVFAFILSMLQVYQGTAPAFSLGCFFFIVISAIAFNIAGGLTRPSGAYIFFFSVLAVITGLTWKAVLGEPADLNLLVPMVTIKVYLCAICGMLGAALVSRRLSTKRPLLANYVSDDNLQNATIGCMVTGVILSIIFYVVPRGEGSFLSALNQLNRFPQMTIFLGTIYAIRHSRHTRSISLPVLVSAGIVFIQGILNFSKEGIITPFICWLLAAASQRYRLSLAQIAGGILMIMFTTYYLVPYSQYGRNFRSYGTFSESLDTSISMLSDLEHVRSEFKATEQEEEEAEIRGYFSHPQGFFDRLQMIGPDDNLNDLTEQGVVTGLYPLSVYFANMVPHFIWADKPTWQGGNIYARQMGFLAEDDYTTGVSFSPASESFHFLRWTGALVIGPILYIMLFTLFDSLCGDIRKSPWGLLITLVFAHIAPEGGLGFLVNALGYVAAAIIFTALTATYVMPIIGATFMGSQKRTMRLRDPLNRPRVRPVDPSATAIG